MTLNPAAHGPSHAIQEMHVLFAADDLTDTDMIDSDVGHDDIPLDDETEAALSVAGLEAMSQSARDLLLRLTDRAESLEPDIRKRLVSAAERGFQWRRDNFSSMPVLLFTRRRTARILPEELAAELSLPSKALTDIESGAEPLQSVSAKLLAHWIFRLHISPDDARSALQHEHTHRESAARAAAAPTQRREQEQVSTYIAEVLRYLNQLRDSGSA